MFLTDVGPSILRRFVLRGSRGSALGRNYRNRQHAVGGVAHGNGFPARGQLRCLESVNASDACVNSPPSILVCVVRYWRAIVGCLSGATSMRSKFS
jgi:hypothetical protein